jgi:GDPmannose 4,6-dehydratase
MLYNVAGPARGEISSRGYILPETGLDKPVTPKALITGISGQDGSYLAELLLEKGYEVHGLVQRVKLEDPERRLVRIQHLLDRLTLHPSSIESFPSLFRAVERIQPDECYHLAAASFVSYSFDEEFAIFNVNVNGTHYMLSVIRESAPHCRFYFAASSEMFGKAPCSPQNEDTPFHPRSAYGITKVTGFHLTQNYRENYGLYACSGILFNHESERRGYEFVTRKITSTVARIKLGRAKELRLGNLDAMRDWGYAPDYVDAMWRMLQHEAPDDYVIATGEPHSVRAFVEAAFAVADLDWRDYVVTDPRFFRPAEEHTLTGDSSKARARLGWEPRVHFEELVRRMVVADLERLEQGQAARSNKLI